MSAFDAFLIVVRWLHALAAVAWVGGGIFYWLVLQPALRQGGQASTPVARTAAREFRSLVELCMGILLVSGMVLAATRLTSALVGVPYFAVLALKIALALWMFWMARALRARRPSGAGESGLESLPRLGIVARALGSPQTIVVMGVIIVLLSDILRFLVELGLSE